ncbi:acetolactate synthase large subunit [Pseudooceanicola sp.]|uniref:acetolactate synthase large subunit n=1 Tax=Pseudooceanicola sp. TaxID=1914328 RepID=UPI0026313198|nr:acetolactate synthase large subunit [Pseudooceanicola sp.]MDF1856136.1 acetolactate synthase large subunit [Pseudooceanicola sp.]
MTNGADLLCDTLLANDVDVCFANPGTSEMHFVAALDRKQNMRCVLGLFEGVVTGCADGYARLADKPAATLLHTGPGLSNGLANLHNARRAGTPMVNVVGDHASYHLPNDAALTTDIESLAEPMSKYVRRCAGADDVSRATADAITQARNAPTGVTTVILPADAAWGELPDDSPVSMANLRAPSRVDDARLIAAIKALKTGAKPVLMLAGKALRAEALTRAQQIAEATGARIIAQQSNARVERGAGRVPVERVPYVVELAQEFLAGTTHLILVGAKAPVTFFAYPNKPTTPMPLGCQVLTLADAGDDAPGALDLLAQGLNLPATAKVTVPHAPIPDLMSGDLTTAAIATAVANFLPDNAIIADESVTSGREFFGFTHGAAPHDHLQVTGGAIGGGLPLACGAAIACPDRKVVNLQADGSAMYTNQALWTMARERTDTCVVIFSNRRYAILQGELTNVGAGEPGRNANKMLNLDDPAIGWVSLANGMGVEAAQASTADQFNDRFKSAMARKGPFLIEALI